MTKSKRTRRFKLQQNAEKKKHKTLSGESRENNHISWTRTAHMRR